MSNYSVKLHEDTCRRQIKSAIDNNYVGASPQKTGGVAIPSHIEESIAQTVKALWEKKLPVFPDDVIYWAASQIEGTEAASYFPDTKPTRACIVLVLA
jgi:hypothetical protein